MYLCYRLVCNALSLNIKRLELEKQKEHKMIEERKMRKEINELISLKPSLAEKEIPTVTKEKKVTESPNLVYNLLKGSE